jgi:hypothetical protein
MTDGAHLGVSADRALKTILGGAPQPTDEETMGVIEFRDWITQPDQELLDYGEAARRVARDILAFWMDDPRRATIPAENVYEHDADGKLVFNDAGGLNLVTPGLYEVMKDHGIDLEPGITGFQWGWAVNAARRCVELPPAPNPAIMSVGRADDA